VKKATPGKSKQKYLYENSYKLPIFQFNHLSVLQFNRLSIFIT